MVLRKGLQSLSSDSNSKPSMLYSTTGQLACKRFLPSDYYGTFFGSSLEALRWLVVISVAWREMAHGIANSGFTLGIYLNTIYTIRKKNCIFI